MTLDDLKARPEFVTLRTEQMKNFVVAYCSNGADPVKAVEAAYNVTTLNSATTIANRLLGSPIIKRLTDEFYGQADETGTRDEFLAILWKKVRGSSDEKTQLGWATLYMKVKGYEQEKAAPPPPAPPSTEDLADIENLLKG